jgi:two-component system OmpR family response regulator
LSVTELRALVVEDDASARSLLVSLLEDDGYEVRAVADGIAALDAVVTFQPDVALVDGSLPGLTGPELARRIRQGGNLPIIFVTGADSADDIHAGFRLGADDYVVKPFDPEELSWRVRAVLRRSGKFVAQAWECGDLVVDEGTMIVTRAGSPVELTAIEFKLLAVLIRSRTRVVPKAQLLNQVWGYEADDHLLEVHISSLRRKLEVRGPRMIRTIRATGYVLRP